MKRSAAGPVASCHRWHMDVISVSSRTASQLYRARLLLSQHVRLFNHTKMPQYSLGVMACQDTGEPSVPVQDLISLHAESLTRHAGGLSLIHI